VAGDNCAFGSYTINNVEDPSDGLDDDLLLGTIDITGGCAVNIGTSGTPIDMSAGKIVHRGTGTLYWASGASNPTGSVIIDSPAATAAVLSGTTYGTITCIRGGTNLSGITNDFDLAVGGTAVVDVASDCGSTACDLVVTGGTVTSHIDWAVITMRGGRVVHDTIAAVELNILGGTLAYNWRDLTDDAADTIDGNVYVGGGGVLDLTRDGLNVVIAGDLTLLAGGTVRCYENQLTVEGKIIPAGGQIVKIG